MNYKVYKLLFPGGEVYIGKTCQNIKSRWESGVGYHEGYLVRAAINKYGWENVQKIILCENLTNEEACKIETEEIIKHGGVGHPLVLNMRDGGDSGFHLTESTKEKISEAKKKLYEVNPEMFDFLKIKVDQYSYDGSTFIASFDSINEAAESINIVPSAIGSCLKGRKLSAGGFRWVEHDKTLGIIQYPTAPQKRRIRVAQINKDTGQIIKVYDSIREASETIGIGQSHISSCINGKRFTTGGYKWEKIS